MHLLCKIFGHRPSRGYYDVNGDGYFTVRLTEVDGIGRQHATLHTECHRCGVLYQVGKIHVPHITGK